MSDSDNKGKKLSLGKNIESGTVKQAISRGRSKNVTVEVKKSKNFKYKSPTEEQDDSGLSEQEREARLKAIREAEERKNSKAEDEKVIGRSTVEVTTKKEEPEQIPAAEAEPYKPVKEERKKEDKDKVNKKDVELNDEVFEEIKAESKTTEQEKIDAKSAREALEKEIERKKKTNATKPKFDDEKKAKKLTISQALDFDSEDRVKSFVPKKKKKKSESTSSAEQEFKSREIIIPEIITVQELSNRMKTRVQDVIKELMKLGIMKRQADEIDADTAELLVTEFNHIPKRVSESDIEDLIKEEEVAEEDLKPRPPVVTVMGHVDHGKTSLLDAIRKTDVTEGEAGGITQHIGAYQITTPEGDRISFIDTPGHAAFTEMRARGADVTDIVILLVAADDGVMPQTIEAINHAKAAEVPIIVAINKIDVEGANPKRVKDELLQHEVVTEDYGGDIQAVEVSAKEGINLEGLVEAVLLQAEILEPKASPSQKPRGAVIESHIDKGRGVIATLLVQKGTLRVSDIVVAGTAFGKIKSVMDENANHLEEADPSRPVEVLGFDEVPAAGELFAFCETEKIARDIVEYRKKLELLNKQKAGAAGNIDNLFKQFKEDSKSLNLIVKGDVHGSVEAIISSINNIETDEVEIKIVHSAAGPVTESDVQLASATGSMVLGFNVRAEGQAKQIAENEGIDVRYYNIIYNLLDDVKALISGLLSPIIREEFLGNAEILEVFKITKVGKIAGCKVTKGVVKRGAGVRLIRDNVVIHEGKLKTLKRFKDEVPEVKEGYECGMAFENYEDIKAGDVIEAYEVVEEQRKLSE